MNNNNNNDLRGIDILSIVSLILDLLNYDLNSKMITNDDIFKELKDQDSNYLKKIINQNEEIITLIKRSENKNG